jgi:hypothetical protein
MGLKTNKLLIELHFLPCIDYIISLMSTEEIVLDAHEYYCKQSYRNRTYIRNSNKILAISLPVIHTNGAKTGIREVRLDYSQRCMKELVRSIYTSYRRAPFFEDYFDPLQQILTQKEIFLWDLNIKLLTVCLKLMDITKTFIYTQEYVIQENKDFLDQRNNIHPKKQVYNPDIIGNIAYKQLFGKQFARNLSIIDLLFCEGPYSASILKKALMKRPDTSIEQINNV